MQFRSFSRRGSAILLLGGLASLFGCSSPNWKLFSSPGRDYRTFVLRHLEQRRIYDRGRQVSTIKVIPATRELRDEQEKLTPGFSFAYKPQFRQVIIAAGFPSAADFAASDLKVSLGGRPMEWVHEMDGPVLNESQYFFAYPFYRVFLFDFPVGDNPGPVEELVIFSPRGAVKVNVSFREGEA